MVDTSDSEVLLRFETISLSESLVTKKEKTREKEKPIGICEYESRLVKLKV